MGSGKWKKNNDFKIAQISNQFKSNFYFLKDFYKIPF